MREAAATAYVEYVWGRIRQSNGLSMRHLYGAKNATPLLETTSQKSSHHAAELPPPPHKYAVQPSLHLPEHKLKRRQRHGEMVQRLIQQPRTVLPGSKAHLILLQKSRSQRSHLHHGYILADAIAWSH